MSRRTTLGLLAVAVAAGAILTFAPGLGNQFTDRDDPELLLENTAWRPFGPAAVRYAFTSTLLGHWVPLTWLSWTLDHALWGLDPFGFHLTSLLVHGATAALLFLVGERLLARGGLGGAPGMAGAVVAALFWGAHPLRAETVAWITERRGVLCGFFYVLAVLGYLAAVGQGPRARRWRLTGSLAALALALASKSMAMTLPATLLVLDVYPLGRLRSRQHWQATRAVLAEKIPYFLLSGAAALAAIVARRGLDSHPAGLVERGLDVAYTLWFHLRAEAWPIGLSPLYEWPVDLDPLAPAFLVAVGGVVLVTAAALALRRRCPAVPAVWVFHVVTLAPVAGWAPLGLQLTADRYGYLPGLGWALLVGTGLAAVVAGARRGAVRRPLAVTLVVATGAWLLVLGLSGARQAVVWRDSRTLWRHAVAVAPGCWRCQEALADWQRTDGDARSAELAYRRALELNPGALRVRRKLGGAQEDGGRLPEAEATYRGALALAPGSLPLAVDLARVLLRMDRSEEGIHVIQAALRVASDDEVRAQLPPLGEAGEAPLALLASTLAAARLGQAEAQADSLRRLRRLAPELAQEVERTRLP